MTFKTKKLKKKTNFIFQRKFLNLTLLKNKNLC